MMNLIVIFLVMLLLFGLFFIKRSSSKNPQKIAEGFGSLRVRRNEDHEKGITEEEIRTVLVSLNLAPFVIKLFDGTENLTKHGFYNVFLPPYSMIDQTKEEQAIYETGRYIPLFETMDDFLEVLAYDNVLQGFIRYCPEDDLPLANYEVLTWDGTFIEQILEWYENNKTDGDILNICKLFGLKHSKEILESIHMNLGSKYTDEDRKNWVSKTIDEIDGRIKQNQQ